MAGTSEAAFDDESGAVMEALLRQEMEPPLSPVVLEGAQVGVGAIASDTHERSLARGSEEATRRAASAPKAGVGGLTAPLKPSRFDEDQIIANDRDLLSALGLSDAVASTYVRKSRQTLNNQLGPQKAGSAPDDYFKPAELLLLVLAANRDCNQFDDSRREMVRDYIAATRGRDDKARKDRAYSLVMETLAGEGRIDLNDSRGIVFVFPDFAGLAAAQPRAVAELSRVATRIAALSPRPWVLILSPSHYQSKMAAQTLGLKGEEIITVSHDHAEHYLSSVLVYNGGDQADPFVVTARGALVPAPSYRSAMMLTCLKDMLEDSVRTQLFNLEEDYRKLAQG